MRETEMYQNYTHKQLCGHSHARKQGFSKVVVHGKLHQILVILQRTRF